MQQKKITRLAQNKKKERLFIMAVLAYPLLNFFVMYVVVNFNSILLAFQQYKDDYSLSFAGFKNFSTVLAMMFEGGGELSFSLKNSLLMFAIPFVLGLPLNMGFSYYIYKKKFASGLLRFLMYIPSIVSGMIMSLVFLYFSELALPSLLRNFGIEAPLLLKDPSTAFGTIIFYMMWTGFASNMILYPNAMNAIPNEVVESAQIDGVTQLQELLFIVIPLIFPTISTFTVTSVAAIFTASGPIYVFFGYDAKPYVSTMGYYIFRTTMSDGFTSYPITAAAGLILTAVSVPVTLFVKWGLQKLDPTEA